MIKYMALATLAFAAWPAFAGDTRFFAAEDVFELEYADDPRISPDGSQIVYERQSNDIMSDRTRSNLWLVGVDGDGHRPLVSGTESASSPRWSPDGDRIVYSRATGNGSGIYVRWMDSGMTALLANLRRDPSNLSWSPDGRWIAFVMSVPGKTASIAEPRPRPEGADWSEPVKVIDKVHYRWDGRGFLETAYDHIFVVPADGGTPRQLTGGDFDHDGPLSWTPDGERILFSANRHDNWELESGEADIFAVAVTDGTLTQITSRQGGESEPVVSPNGRHVAYLASENRPIPFNTRVLHVMAADGSDDRPLSAGLDRSVSNLQWAGDRRIYFQYDDHAVRKVARVNLDGDIEPVVDGLGSTSLGRPYTSGSYTVAANGTVAYTYGTAYRPADVAVAGRRGSGTLTALNDDLLSNRSLGQVTEIIYASSHDGQQIQGWYLTPPDYQAGKRYPLILEIHGGPHLAYGPYFSAEMQLMTAAGYIVFFDNHRGSTGYGADFAMLLHNKYASPDDFADHMSGVDAVIDKGIVDADNLFITGGSAGGIASAYAIGLTDRFNAAAVAKPVINWISKTLTGDSYVGQISHQFPGMPWEEFEHYWQRSPLSLVGNMVTPTMLITGEEDYRTPISETEQLYQALKLRGVDTVMIRVPGSSHGIAGRPSRLVAKVDNILAWFARYRTDLEGGRQ
jgi:dipeptidyl aminopeptidase/acylaminoacyl peptidase